LNTNTTWRLLFSVMVFCSCFKRPAAVSRQEQNSWKKAISISERNIFFWKNHWYSTRMTCG
jgi:hypothetical protein